ncbi:electron transfer flavoprotein subunit beta/FixA family protein [Geosporobacter ferrireducens]|uniref:Electron transfer flavoprotein small subunit n=1 Tax=Geosporobacter ferrireducens TaxID=1424294 RepID=A0A1D8GDC3_9FIRM|nr:electron transfer flavoprotein subunit beta/FixA family protein [Geosporobacter ferrireducens]AOT68896.1 hypothetical protein Gferi_04585 [Geosporobacter ferrireducens]MTI54870.1 electron transfer flavoprotein subunit beta/FixA family protein [Geosporobacter ferrireducens]
MKIAVCIKQVPASSEIETDQNTGVLIRDRGPTRINPYDLSAIEAALQLKEAYNGSVTSFTMGPKSAEAVIAYSFSMGADDGVLLSDARFAGADVYATAYTLAQGICVSDHYDLILCGSQTTDGDTGQVGPALAEQLGIPHIYGVTAVDSINETQILLTQQLGNKNMQLKAAMPCLLVIHPDAFRPRLPSLKLKLMAAKKEVKKLSMQDMQEKNILKYGLKGSPTQVERVFLPERTTYRQVLTGDGDTLALEIYNCVKQGRLI